MVTIKFSSVILVFYLGVMMECSAQTTFCDNVCDEESTSLTSSCYVVENCGVQFPEVIQSSYSYFHQLVTLNVNFTNYDGNESKVLYSGTLAVNNKQVYTTIQHLQIRAYYLIEENASPMFAVSFAVKRAKREVGGIYHLTITDRCDTIHQCPIILYYTFRLHVFFQPDSPLICKVKDVYSPDLKLTCSIGESDPLTEIRFIQSGDCKYHEQFSSDLLTLRVNVTSCDNVMTIGCNATQRKQTYPAVIYFDECNFGIDNTPVIALNSESLEGAVQTLPPLLLAWEI